MVKFKSDYAEEGRCVADVLLWEEPHEYSRERVTVVTGSGEIAIGQVLGKITASGKYTPVDPTAVDGSEEAVAVAIEAEDATASDKTVLAIVRDAIVAEQELVWHANLDTENERTAAKAELAAVGIVSRAGA